MADGSTVTVSIDERRSVAVQDWPEVDGDTTTGFPDLHDPWTPNSCACILGRSLVSRIPGYEVSKEAVRHDSPEQASALTICSWQVSFRLDVSLSNGAYRVLFSEVYRP